MIKILAATCGLLLLTATACDGANANIEVTTDDKGKITVDKDGKTIKVESMKVNLNKDGVHVEVKDEKGKTQVIVDEKATK